MGETEDRQQWPVSLCVELVESLDIVVQCYKFRESVPTKRPVEIDVGILEGEEGGSVQNHRWKSTS